MVKIILVTKITSYLSSDELEYDLKSQLSQIN